MSDTTSQPSPAAHLLLPPLALLSAQFSSTIGAALAKSLFPLVGAEGMTAYRVGFAALLLMAVTRPWRHAVAPHARRNLLVYGAVLGVMNLLIYRAFSRLPIGVAIAIEVTGPLTVVLLASRRASDFAFFALAVAGLYLLLPLGQASGRLDPVGVAYAFGAAVCWALYIVFGKRVSTLAGGQALGWGMGIAALIAVPVGVAHVGAGLLAPSLMLSGAAIAVLSSVLPYSLEMVALRRLPHGVFSMLSSAAPAVGALAGMLVLGELLSQVQWLAIACIVVASGGCAITAQRRA